MHDLEQGCLKVLVESLRKGLADDNGAQVTQDKHIDDDVPTLTIYADGKPIIQIVVIATDLTPEEPAPERA